MQQQLAKMHVPSKAHSLLVDWAIVLILLIVSLLGIVFLRQDAGMVAVMIAILPIIVAAWRLGTWGGILVTFIILLSDIIISFLFRSGSLEPILMGERLIGASVAIIAAIVVGWIRKSAKQSERELSQCDHALQKQDAYTGFLSALNDMVSASLEAEDMSSMLKMLANRMGELFGTDNCFITRWDETLQRAVPTAAYGPLSGIYHTLRPEPKKYSLSDSVLKAGHALAVENVQNIHYLNTDLGAKFPSLSELALPLVAGGRKLGAVILGFHSPHHFTEDEITRGELAARQISLAMTKVILLEDARHRVRELAGLHEISQTFTLHGDDRRTYGLVTEILAGLMEARICILGLYDSASHELRAQVPAYGMNNELVETFRYSADMGGPAWKFTEGGVFNANTRAELPAEFAPLARMLGLESILVAPLWDAGHQLIGAIYAANKSGGFDKEDIRLMEIFASQVAVVIQNTRLLLAERRRAEQLAVLHAIAVAATEADDEDELIERATRLIGEGLYPDNLSILLKDEAMGELYLHSSFRLGGMRENLIRIPLGIGITGAVAKSGKARRMNDISQTPDYLTLDPLMWSELCVPINVGERVIGVVDIESTKQNAFTQQDEDLLAIIAGQLATAIQRLRITGAERQQTERLTRSNAMIKALVQVGARSATASDPDGVMQTLGNELAKLGLTCLVALSDAENKYIIIRYTSLPRRTVKLIERLSNQKMSEYSIPLERLVPLTDPVRSAVLINDPVALASQMIPEANRRIMTKILDSIGMVGNTTVCHLSLIIEGKIIGILWMWGEGLRESDLPTISLFASQITTTLQNANLLAEVRRLAITDELTGIYNRRHFFNLAEKEFKRAYRYGHPLSAMIVDIDHFKQFNDRYGHLVGDQVLRTVTQQMQISLRESDILGRYGGEEFVILLPNTALTAAVKVAERLHSQVANADILTDGGTLRARLSVGVSMLDDDIPTLHALINRADQAMYKAKGAGRNCIATK